MCQKITRVRSSSCFPDHSRTQQTIEPASIPMLAVDAWAADQASQAESPQRPGTMARDMELRASRHVIRPFPFSKPVPAASSFTLEFRHSSPALRTNQVNDRRDEARVRFTRQCVKGFHNRSPILISDQCEGRPGHKNGNGAAGFRLSIARSGWLRSPFRNTHACQPRELEIARTLPTPAKQ